MLLVFFLSDPRTYVFLARFLLSFFAVNWRLFFSRYCIDWRLFFLKEFFFRRHFGIKPHFKRHATELGHFGIKPHFKRHATELVTYYLIFFLSEEFIFPLILIFEKKKYHFPKFNEVRNNNNNNNKINMKYILMWLNTKLNS